MFFGVVKSLKNMRKKEMQIILLESKLADITPVHKKEDTTKTKNYRPVSVLPPVSKLLEKLMEQQIISYIDKYLSPYLCGYRKGFSTEQALLSLTENWKLLLDKQGYGGAVLMDLSKAFATLNHDLLIAKLHAYGFDKSSLKLVKSYLTNRWQRTKINMSFSSWSELLKGVPQGSILGPLLFKSHPTKEMRFVKIGFCGVRIFNVILWCPHF